MKNDAIRTVVFSHSADATGSVHGSPCLSKCTQVRTAHYHQCEVEKGITELCSPEAEVKTVSRVRFIYCTRGNCRCLFSITDQSQFSRL